MFQPPLFDSLRDLKPENGGHVYGEAEYAYHSASNVNGKTTEHNAGHKIINEDGRVKEFDFTPSTSHAPLVSINSFAKKNRENKLTLLAISFLLAMRLYALKQDL